MILTFDLWSKSNYADTFISIFKSYKIFSRNFSVNSSVIRYTDNVFYIMARYDSHILSIDVSDLVPMITRVKQDNVVILCSDVILRSFNESNPKAFKGSLASCNWMFMFIISKLLLKHLLLSTVLYFQN